MTTDPALAAAALAAGHLAALPTETVYGLGGLASSSDAIAAIYRAKGRPADHPVIVHVSSAAAIGHWARDIPATATALAEAFWPGPLTLVLPRAAGVSDALTGGQDTIALRAPDHPLFAAVLDALEAQLGPGVGIAAPSANRFGRVSPTTAAAVVSELGDRLGDHDVILDGGPCDVGLESTIVVCEPDFVYVVREGGVTHEQLRGVVEVRPSPAATARVPGSLASHYAPRARVIVLSDPGDLVPPSEAAGERPTTGLIALAHIPTPPGWVRLAAPTDDRAYAHTLYAALRQADSESLTTLIAIPPPPENSLTPAILDRLMRAAAS